MQPFFEDYLSILEERHQELLNALDGLPGPALDWNPGPEMNSIAVLIFHLTGAERYWIGDVVAQVSSNRDRDAEFKVHGVELDRLKSRINDNLAYARTVLNGLVVSDLEAARRSPRDGSQVKVGWALMHALEHLTLHLGHIQLTRQLWKQSH